MRPRGLELHGAISPQGPQPWTPGVDRRTCLQIVRIVRFSDALDTFDDMDVGKMLPRV